MIEDRLDNWSRYYRTRVQVHVCGSMEGKLYRSPWRQWVPLTEIQYPLPIDWQDAELVETAWRQMIGVHKDLLKYIYMHALRTNIVARKCRIKIWHLDDETRKAMSSIARILDKLSPNDRLAPNSNRSGEIIQRNDAGSAMESKTQAP